MNCREGDLALVIRGVDAGKTVTCLELVKPGSTIPGQEDLPTRYENTFALDVGYIWRIDRLLVWTAEHQPSDGLPFAPDRDLQPLTPRGVVKQLFELEGLVESKEAVAAKRKAHIHD